MHHNIELIKEKYLPFLQEMIDHDFNDALTHNNNVDFDEWAENTDLNFGNYELNYNCGASRQVFWFDNSDVTDYVFKYDLSKHSNYTEKEYQSYQKAKAAGLDEYFAWIDKFIDINTSDGNVVTIYVMEYCEMAEDTFSEDGYEVFDAEYEDAVASEISKRHLSLEKDSNEIDNIREELSGDYEFYTGDEIQIFDRILPKYWTYTTINKINDFLCENSINDCHCGNFGFRVDGSDQLVLTDYAGYMGQILKFKGGMIWLVIYIFAVIHTAKLIFIN